VAQGVQVGRGRTPCLLSSLAFTPTASLGCLLVFEIDAPLFTNVPTPPNHPPSQLMSQPANVARSLNLEPFRLERLAYLAATGRHELASMRAVLTLSRAQFRRAYPRFDDWRAAGAAARRRGGSGGGGGAGAAAVRLPRGAGARGGSSSSSGGSGGRPAGQQEGQLPGARQGPTPPPPQSAG
jgi:hypothetical protein